MTNNPINGVWRQQSPWIHDLHYISNGEFFHTSKRTAVGKNDCWSVVHLEEEDGELLVLRQQDDCTESEAIAWVGRGQWPGEPPIEAAENVDGIWYDHESMFDGDTHDSSRRVAIEQEYNELFEVGDCVDHKGPLSANYQFIRDLTDEQAARWVGLGEWPEGER